MKRLLETVCITMALALASVVTAAEQDAPLTPATLTNIPPKVLSFCADKEQQLRDLTEKLGLELPPAVADLFEAAKKGDLPLVADLHREVRGLLTASSDSADQAKVDAMTSATTLEVLLALEQFAEGDARLAVAMGNEIIKSIPAGSIYFGGTDPGRGLITTLSTSHEKAEPFFTLTQNALADGRYLTYLRTMYGDRICTPAKEDSEAAFKEYLDDAKARLEHDRQFPNGPRQIKPGENVRRNGNLVNVTGQVAVMAINGLLAKMIFERNPGREFYVEESFPLDWMYPHLSPNGPIMRINRDPVPALSGDAIGKDRKYWLDLQRTKIGSWLRPPTPIQEVCDFVQRVFVNHDFKNFAGDTKYVQDVNACKFTSKLRSSIGGLYSWRAKNARQPEEKERMKREADFAFRQAFALCPYSAEAVFRYVNLLIEDNRLDDALRVAEASSNVEQKAGSFDVFKLIEEIERLKNK